MELFSLSLVLTIILLIVIMAIILAYRKEENSYRKQLLNKMDSLIELLQAKNADK